MNETTPTTQKRTNPDIVLDILMKAGVAKQNQQIMNAVLSNLAERANAEKYGFSVSTEGLPSGAAGTESVGDNGVNLGFSPSLKEETRAKLNGTNDWSSPTVLHEMMHGVSSVQGMEKDINKRPLPENDWNKLMKFTEVPNVRYADNPRLFAYGLSGNYRFSNGRTIGEEEYLADSFTNYFGKGTIPSEIPPELVAYWIQSTLPSDIEGVKRNQYNFTDGPEKNRYVPGSLPPDIKAIFASLVSGARKR